MEEEEKSAEQEIKISSATMKELDESNEVENLKKIEAALFLAARFLSLNDLVLLTDINPLMLKELMDKLISKYNTEESAIEIIVKENMWKMDVAKEYVSMVNKLATGSSEFSKAEQETLAVIAYKQPVKQSVIINIRGNKAYDHVKHFIEIGLVQAKRAGHTKELRLSDDFFDYFHLQKKEGQEIGEIISVEGEDEESIVNDTQDIGQEQTGENVQEDGDNSKNSEQAEGDEVVSSDFEGSETSKIEGVKEDGGG